MLASFTAPPPPPPPPPSLSLLLLFCALDDKSLDTFTSCFAGLLEVLVSNFSISLTNPPLSPCISSLSTNHPFPSVGVLCFILFKYEAVFNIGGGIFTGVTVEEDEEADVGPAPAPGAEEEEEEEEEDEGAEELALEVEFEVEVGSWRTLKLTVMTSASASRFNLEAAKK